MRRYNLFRIATLCTFLLLMLLWASAAPTNARIEPDDGIVRVKSAVSMAEAIRRIIDANNQFLRTASAQIGRDVVGCRIVPSFVNTHTDAIDENFGFPIHRVEVEEHFLSAPRRRHGERPAVPGSIVILLHP